MSRIRYQREGRLGIDSGATSEVVGRTSLSVYLARHVLELIRSEGLESGDRLPSVRELARRFSVTPPTIREALGRLQANGVVEIRHGSGVYVRSGRERAVLANPNHEGSDPDTLLDLLDARLFIEPHLAGSAAGRIREAEVADLERLLDDASCRLDGSDDEGLHRANWSFHRTIAGLAENTILAQMIDSLLDLYKFEQLRLISFYDDRVRDHREHIEILEAIRSADSKLARELMHRHLKGVRDTVEAKQGRGESTTK